MTTNYASETLTKAIKNHLWKVDAIPPTAEATELARELAQVCLTELNTVGLGSETVEDLFAPFATKTKARGAH
ncbi:MAG: hypothetical protein H7Z16_15855 [Pyrinomonadaceae bacterium]|nr:hypothetical protein [Pyrinomonadaceae bacterium]